MRRLLLLAPIVLGLAAAPSAHAGSYAVVFCGPYGNHSWTGVAATGIARDEGCEGSDPMGNRVGGGGARAARRDRHHDLHRSQRDDDRRLLAHPPARLPQRDARQGHAPALRALQARQHRVRRRRPLPERHPRPAALPGQLVRLPRGERRGAEEHRVRRQLPGARGLHRERQDAPDRDRLLQRHARHRLHHRGGRRHLPPALRRPGRAQRPDAAGGRHRSVRPAVRRPPERLGRHHARRDRQRRHPPRRGHRPQRRRRRGRQ